MRKILATVAVALIASSMVFAGISGYGQLGYGYDLDTKDTGFANDTNIKVDIDVATASEEKQAEGAIYAKVSGSLKVWAFNGKKGAAADDPDGTVKPAIAITDVSASINGADWSVDVLGMPARLDLAKSVIDYKTVKYEDDDYGFEKPDYDKYTTYAVNYVKAPGIGITYKGFVLGLGFNYKNADSADNKTVLDVTTKKYVKGTDFTAVLNTPEISLQDALTVKAGISFYQNQTATLKTKTDKTQKGADVKKLATDRGTYVGGSVSVAYAGDAFSAKVAADLGYAVKAYKVEDGTNAVVKDDAATGKFSMDAAVNAKIDPITLDVYYKYDGSKADVKDANLLSVQAKADLSSFDVPVAVTVYGKDVIKEQTVGGKVEVAPVDGLKVAAGGSYGIAGKKWSADASAEYAFDVATLAGKVKLGNSDVAVATDVVLGFDVSVKTTTLVPGAELSLAYAADDVLQKSTSADLDNGHLGSLTAKCKVSF